MKITCISDLHGFYPKLPGGDLLIIAGDLTKSDRLSQYEEFNLWLMEQDYHKIVFVAGNHDKVLQKMSQVLTVDFGANIIYLCDSGTEFMGFQIWGSPWIKTFAGLSNHCNAFAVKEEVLEEKWALIPDDVDILITHSPPYGTLDKCGYFREDEWDHAGSVTLAQRLLNLKKLKLHVFGHIHEEYGQCDDRYISVNASYCDIEYQPGNPPIEVIL